MNRSFPLALCVILLGACATVSSPIPQGYTGPTVYLVDSGYSENSGKGVFFSATMVNGREIENSLRETRAASHGELFSLRERYTSRQLPVMQMKVKLVGTHQTAAPIHEFAARMAGTFFTVEGTVDFTPTEGHTYTVTGDLKKAQSCVWIMDGETKQIVTKKVCMK